MSIGVTVRPKFRCAIGNRKATFKICGGESRSLNRGEKGGCDGGVDANDVEVHKGISDCLFGFQPADKRFSPDSCVLGPSSLNLPITMTAFSPSSICIRPYRVKYHAGSFATLARQASHNFPSVLLAGCRESGID